MHIYSWKKIILLLILGRINLIHLYGVKAAKMLLNYFVYNCCVNFEYKIWKEHVYLVKSD